MCAPLLPNRVQGALLLHAHIVEAQRAKERAIAELLFRDLRRAVDALLAVDEAVVLGAVLAIVTIRQGVQRAISNRGFGARLRVARVYFLDSGVYAKSSY